MECEKRQLMPLDLAPSLPAASSLPACFHKEVQVQQWCGSVVTHAGSAFFHPQANALTGTQVNQ